MVKESWVCDGSWMWRRSSRFGGALEGEDREASCEILLLVEGNFFYWFELNCRNFLVNDECYL